MIHRRAAALLSAFALLPGIDLLAQLQYIPDPWMRSWLNGLSPGCVDAGGFLDPEHPGLDTVTSAEMTVNSLDLTGLQFLHHLKELTMTIPGAAVLAPVLPDSLERLVVSGYGFASPLVLSQRLRYVETETGWGGTLAAPLPLSIDSLLLHGYSEAIPFDMPVLHEGLVYLISASPWLASIQNLPGSLRHFECLAGSTPCMPVLPGVMDAVTIACGVVDCLPNVPYTADPNMTQICTGIDLCTVLDDCPFGAALLGGRLWHDPDGDQAYDTIESGMVGDAVLVQPSGHLISTSTQGRWRSSSDTGAFTITPLPASPYATNIAPASTSALLSSMQPVDTAMAHSYHLTPGIVDLSLDLVAQQPFIGVDRLCYATITNVGTTTTSGTLQLQLDTDVLITSTTPPAQSINGNTVVWTIDSVHPGQQHQCIVHFELVSGTQPGSDLFHWAQVVTVGADVNGQNNIAEVHGVVLLALDPNDKLVVPSNAEPIELLNGIDLSYTVRFQNTGNFPAQRVVITDTLPPALDPFSMHFVSASHPCSWTVADGVLIFVFDPIVLPDSSSDPSGSQGFVRFAMHASPTPQPGNQVVNVANIYFDQNAAIVTPPAVFEVAITAGHPDKDQPSSGYAIWPNPVPANGRLHVRSLPTSGELKILDLMGRVQPTKGFDPITGTIDIGPLSGGSYLLQLTMPGKRETHLFAVE